MQIDTEKGLVRSVQISPSGERSEVRIRLRTADVRVKDSTLQSPARIVIDVRKAGAATAKAAPKPKATQKTVAPAPTVTKAPAPAPAPKPVEKPVEKVPVVAKPAPAPAPVAEKAADVELNKEPAATEPTQEEIAKKLEEAAAAKAPPVSRPNPSHPVNRVNKKAAPAPAAAPANAFDIRLVGGGILMLLVGIGGFIWKRRRSVSSEAGDEVDAIEGDWFAADSAGSNAADAAQEESSPPSAEVEDLPASRAGTSEAPLFGSDTPASPPTLDRVAPVTSLDSVADVPPSGGGSGISAAQFQELQGQINKIEGRLSDFEAARERLEQQGVNQTEELRVQRAAIARTQRVLRSITRTEDDGSGDAAGTPSE
jgi:hypothetical protein